MNNNNTAYDGYDVCKENCGCPDTGNITSKELQQTCAFLWMVVCRDCKETPVRITPERFAKFIAEYVEVDYTLVQQMIDEKFTNYDFSNFVTTQELTNVINAIVIPDAGVSADEVDTAIADTIQNYSTTAQINALLADYSTTTAINTLLENYYTRTQVNDLIDGLQQQIGTLNSAIINLQTQIDACCNTASLTPPTGDWPNVLTGACPAVVSSVVANPDNLPITFTVASGGATLSVTANGTPVPLVNATIPDGATVEMTISHPSANVIGGINVTFEDNGTVQNIDGIQYDIQCATTPTNTAPASNGAVANTTNDEGVEFTVAMAPCFSDADGDTLTYAITPQPLPLGFTFDSATGELTVVDTAVAGVYNFSVVANDGTVNSAPCTTTVTIEEVVTQGLTVDCGAAEQIAHTGGMAGFYNGNVGITNSSGDVTLSVAGLNPDVAAFFQEGINPASGNYAFSIPAGYAGPYGPDPYDVIVTDNVTNETFTCVGAGVITISSGGGGGT